MLPRKILISGFCQLTLKMHGPSPSIWRSLGRVVGIAGEGGSLLAGSSLERLSRQQPGRAFRIAGSLGGEL
jgi:hypothetical protein